MEKWLVSGVGQENQNVNMEQFMVPESKEVQKKKKKKKKKKGISNGHRRQPERASDNQS